MRTAPQFSQKLPGKVAVLLRTAARFSQKDFFKNHPSRGLCILPVTRPPSFPVDLNYILTKCPFILGGQLSNGTPRMCTAAGVLLGLARHGQNTYEEGDYDGAYIHSERMLSFCGWKKMFFALTTRAGGISGGDMYMTCPCSSFAFSQKGNTVDIA